MPDIRVSRPKLTFLRGSTILATKPANRDWGARRSSLVAVLSPNASSDIQAEAQ